MTDSSEGAAMCRVVCNRDERRSRAAALPPRIWRSAGISVWSPFDPESGGTWIAVTDRGLVFTVLNVTRDGPRTDRQTACPTSRGLIIPALAGSHTLEDVRRKVAELNPRAFAAFRALVVGDGRILDVLAVDGRVRCSTRPLAAPTLRTSSSLGDSCVQLPRRRLFTRLLRDSDAASAQDRFHHHCWADRPAISVQMQRDDACTVSRTTIEVHERAAFCTYEPLAAGAGGDRRVWRLPLCPRSS